MKAMSPQNFSTAAAGADLPAVKTAIATIKEKLPLLAGLTAAECGPVLRTVANHLSLVQNMQASARPERLPSPLDTSQPAAGQDLAGVLADLVAAVEKLVLEMDGPLPAAGGAAASERDALSLMREAQKITRDARRFNLD
jgi:hypothetical protein